LIIQDLSLGVLPSHQCILLLLLLLLLLGALFLAARFFVLFVVYFNGIFLILLSLVVFLYLAPYYSCLASASNLPFAGISLNGCPPLPVKGRLASLLWVASTAPCTSGKTCRWR
jgi:hypothetical protein